jgi:hypothetical protein
MSDNEKEIVYWAPNALATPEFPINWNLMYRVPERVGTSNKFLLKTTVGTDYTYDFNSLEFKSNIHTYISGRNEGDLDGNNLVLNLGVGWLFFSENSLKMSITNPTENEAPHVLQGLVKETTYDISRWFPPVEAKFYLLDEQKSFSFEREEPVMCVEFLTDKEIVFKRFELTENLMYLSNGCTRSSIIFDQQFDKEQLENLFIDTETNKLVLKNIKNSLV